MGALLPLLIQAAPIFIDLIAKHQGPIQDFFGKLTGGQKNPLGDLLGLIGGSGAGGTGSSSPEVEAQLKRIADALEALVKSSVVPHPVS